MPQVVVSEWLKDKLGSCEDTWEKSQDGWRALHGSTLVFTQGPFPVGECVSTVYMQFLLAVNVTGCLQALDKM